MPIEVSVCSCYTYSSIYVYVCVCQKGSTWRQFHLLRLLSHCLTHWQSSSHYYSEVDTHTHTHTHLKSVSRHSQTHCHLHFTSSQDSSNCSQTISLSVHAKTCCSHTHTHTGTKVPTCLHIHAYITGVISVDGLKNSINFTFTHRSVNSFIHSVSQPVELTTTLTRRMLKHALVAYFPPLCGNNSKIFNFVNLQNSRIFHLHLNRKCRTLVQHGWWQAASGKWQVIVKLQNWI